MAKFVIGLTGGIGSGKTTVSDLFAELGVDIIDADLVAREVVAIGTPALAEISNKFGQDFLLADGSLNRSKLREQVFKHPEDKQWLNSLLHPLIRQQMSQQISAAKSSYALLVAPLLIENDLVRQVDKVLVVDVSESKQIERTTARDNNTAEQVQRIIASQVSREQRLASADYVIDNDQSSLAQLKIQVRNLHQEFLQLANEC